MYTIYMSDTHFGTCLSPNCLQAECWWDCDIRSHQLLDRGQAIADPQCLGDCFSQTNGWSTGQTRERDTRCLSALIEDVTARGTCNIEGNPALELDGVWSWSECTWEFNIIESLEQLVEYDLDGDGMIEGEITIQKIIKGTLSERTEELWKTPACLKSLLEQPFIIRRTFQLLLKFSSSDDLYSFLHPFISGLTTRNVRKSEENSKTSTRLAPVQEVNTEYGTKTVLNYENTRHRYPWICSLRTKGITAEHVCAVTLLSKPPQPTIIVGPAHCTYLCKDSKPRGARLDACCCTPGPPGCKEDVLRFEFEFLLR